MRILVVEDEIHLATAIGEGLTDKGFDVELSYDGLDGLWRARERTYAAIVLDILLPGLNGYRICQLLRQEGNWTPILMLTAKTGEYDEAEAFDTGADDYLSKPFSFVVLVARLRALTRRRPAPRPRQLVAGDLALDPVHRTCQRGTVPIELTRREYALLEALLRHQGQVVTKVQLLKEVWGEDFDDTNVIEVYVSYLRRKIDAPFGRRTLQTVRNAGGYTIVADD